MNANIKVLSVKNPLLLKVSSPMPEIGQNIALHALPTARNSAFPDSDFQVYSTSFFPCSLCSMNCMVYCR